MKRIPQRELLDDDLGTPEEISSSLQDLRVINRTFGGIATSRWLLQQGMESARVREAAVLEVAAGDGFSIRAAVAGMDHGLRPSVTLLDRRASHLSNGDLKSVTGDALQLPFGDESFDFVSCGLFVHHLAPEDVVCFASEALRVARHALLVNDIVRSRGHLALVYLGLPLFRSRLTRHDAPASVRQAYTADELKNLLEKVSPSSVQISRRFLYRVGAIAWK